MSAPGRLTTDAPSVVSAVVHACEVETKYLRAGSGNVMVLIASDLEREDVLKTIKTLSHEFLVFAAAPEISHPTILGRWLREFLECLGAEDAHVVLHASASALFTGDSSNA